MKVEKTIAGAVGVIQLKDGMLDETVLEIRVVGDLCSVKVNNNPVINAPIEKSLLIQMLDALREVG